jgi:hypothetical protein
MTSHFELVAYSPADFQDAEETRPACITFDIGGHGSTTPFTLAVNNMITKGVDEQKARGLMLHQGWKKKMKDFMSQKNNELLEFLQMPLKEHPVLGRGEVLLKRFGNPQVSPNHPSVKDIVIDMSGADVLAEINAALEGLPSDSPMKDLMTQSRYVYERYREAGEEVVKCQNLLRSKLDKLDSIQTKLIGLFDIETNDEYQGLMESVEKYLGSIYKENQIETDFKALLSAYRRFALLREAIDQLRYPYKAETDPMCSICIQEPVSFVISPCGHTFCSSCIKRQNSHCFMCRGNIKDRIKFYFG